MSFASVRPHPRGRPPVFPVIALVLVTIACGGGPENGSDSTPASPAGTVQVQIERPSWSSSLAGIQERTREVIREPAAWAAFWQSFAGASAPAPQVPVVDLDRFMIVVAAMGRRPSAGYDIAIESAELRDGTLHIAVLETSPAPGCIAASVVTTPATAVLVTDHPGPIEFEERQATRTC